MKSKVIKCGACDRKEGEGCAYRVLWRNMREKYHFECLGLDVRIILKRILSPLIRRRGLDYLLTCLLHGAESFLCS